MSTRRLWIYAGAFLVINLFDLLTTYYTVIYSGGVELNVLPRIALAALGFPLFAGLKMGISVGVMALCMRRHLRHLLPYIVYIYGFLMLINTASALWYLFVDTRPL